MPLFICSTHCESCEETATCPMKGQVATQTAEKIGDLPDPIKKIMLAKIEKLAPADFLESTEISVFNFLSLIKFLQNDGIDLTVSDIAFRLEDAISKKRPDIKDNDLPFKEKIQAMILTVAQRIFESVSGNCQRDCRSCYLAEECKLLKDLVSVSDSAKNGRP